MELSRKSKTLRLNVMFPVCEREGCAWGRDKVVEAFQDSSFRSFARVSSPVSCLLLVINPFVSAFKVLPSVENSPYDLFKFREGGGVCRK